VIKYSIISIVLLIGITLVYADSDAPTPREILEKKCYSCHNIKIVLKAQKDKKEWEKTLDRMVEYGAELDQEEREVLIEYLTEE
jgi:cytochrome c5